MTEFKIYLAFLTSRRSISIPAISKLKELRDFIIGEPVSFYEFECLFYS